MIDDNPIDLLVHTKILETTIEGARIKKMQSGIEALAHLKNNPKALPDVIFLDIRMPLMDGFEFLQNLRDEGHPVLGHSRIFIVSSSMDPQDLVRAEKAKELSGFVQKPINRGEVMDLLLAKP